MYGWINKLKTKRLSPRVLKSIFSAGVFLSSFLSGETATEAGNIEAISKGVSAESNLSDFNQGKTNVANIYPGKFVSNVGLNVFKTFKVNNNDVANIHFNNKANTQKADSVVNNVLSRIEVNGVVNAIKENKIGGNLYFISKDGMLVGSKGVVNAGSLTVTTPKNNFFSDSKELDQSKADSYIGGSTDGLYAWTTGIKNFDDDKITLNKTANITILGSINTVEGVHIRAPFIYVGGQSRDAEGKTSTADVGKATRIRSGVDFSSLVNTKNYQELNSDQVLKLVNDETGKVEVTNGAIKLTAYADIINHKSEDTGTLYDILGTNVNGHNETKAEIIEAAGAKIDGAGAVALTAKSVNAQGDVGFLGFDYQDWTAASLLGGKVTRTVANVDIQGDVKGKSVDLKADTLNKYVSSDVSELINIVTNTREITNLGNYMDSKLEGKPVYDFIKGVKDSLSFSLALIDGEAKVVVGQKANVASTEKDVNLSAKSEVFAVSKAKMQNDQYLIADSLGQRIDNGINLGLNLAFTNSKATVDIDGTLSSKGSVNLSAVSKNTVKQNTAVLKPSAPEAGFSSQSSYLNFVAGYMDFDSTATVNVNGTISAEDTVGIKTNNDKLWVESVMEVTTDPNSKANLALTITDAKGRSTINLNNTISAAAIDISAESGVDTLDVEAQNAINPESDIIDAFLKHYKIDKFINGASLEKGLGLAVKAVADKISKKVAAEQGVNLQDGQEGGDNHIGEEVQPQPQPEQPAKWYDHFGLGSAIVVNNTDVDAKVNIAKTALLDAGKGAVSINAESIVGDSYVYSNTAVSNGSSEARKDFSNSALVGVAFAYNNVKNTASVNVEGGTPYVSAKNPGVHAVIKGSDIDINAETGFEWDRINAMLWTFKDDWRKAWENLWDKDIVNKCKEVNQAMDELSKAPHGSLEEKEAINKKAQAVYDMLNNIVRLAGDEMVLVAKTKACIAQIKGMMDASSYSQFYVNASGNANGDAKANWGVNGALGINITDNNAKVVIGQNSVINGSGAVNFNAITHQTDSALFGKSVSILDIGGVIYDVKKKGQSTKDGVKSLIFNNGGSEIAAGGTVGVNYNDLSSTVIVGQGAEITGETFSAKADNKALNVGVYVNGADSESFGFNGIGSYQYGTSNSIVAIDNNAKIDLKGNNDAVYADDKGEVALLPGEMRLNSVNDTKIVSVIGDIVNTGNQGIGLTSGTEKLELNSIAGVMDNSIYTPDKEHPVPHPRENAELTNLYDMLSKSLGDSYSAANFGTYNSSQTKGTIKASQIDISSENSSQVHNFTIAGVYTSKKEEEQQEDNNRRPVVGDNGFHNLIEDLDEDQAQADANADTKLKLSAAGSISVNMVKNTTASLLENTNITLTPTTNKILNSKTQQVIKTLNTGGINVTSFDKTYTGAYSGAAAISNIVQPQAPGFEATFSGAFAVNKVEKHNVAQIRGTSITGAHKIENLAENEGSVVAAGLGVGAEIGGRAATVKGFDVTLSGSINLADAEVHANITDTEITGTKASGGNLLTDLQNVAKDNDVQVAGGVSLEYAKNSVAVGASVARNKLKNDVQALLNNVKTANKMDLSLALNRVDNYALSNLTQFGMGISGGIASSKDGLNYLSLEASTSVNNITNDVKAKVIGSAIAANDIKVQALDQQLDGEGNPYIEYLEGKKLDPKAKELRILIDNTKFADGVDTEQLHKDAQGLTEYKVGTEGPKDNTIKYKNADLKLGQETNSLIAGAAVSVDVGIGSKAAVGSGFAVNNIDNDYTASVENSTITTVAGMDAKGAPTVGSLDVKAKSDTLMVGVGVGISVSTKAVTGKGIADISGSVASNKTDNDTIAQVVNSTINSDKTNIDAATTSKLVAIAGAINGTSSRGGIGLTVATNNFDNVTRASSLNTSINGLENAVININSTDDAKIDAASFGVAATGKETWVNVNGNIAVNKGQNSTIAEVDTYNKANVKTDYKKIKSLNVKAKDTTIIGAGAAGVFAGNNYVNGGVAVAYNEINDQELRSSLNYAKVDTVEGSNIEVKTEDKTNLLGVALGVGVGVNKEGFSLELEATTADNKVNKKKNSATINNTSIDETAKTKKAVVNAKAQNASTVTATSDAVSVGIGDLGANVGLTVSVNEITSTDTAEAVNSKLNVKDLTLDAQQTNELNNVSIGVGFADENIGAMGSGSQNDINAHVYSQAIGSTIASDGNVAILAKDDSSLLAVNGGLNTTVAISQGRLFNMGLGTNVNVNTIDSNVIAKAENSDIIALGGEAIAVHAYSTDEENEEITKHFDEKHKGLVVDAYSKEDVTTVAVTVGVSANTSFTLDLAAAANSTTLKGTTGSYLNSTNVNTKAANNNYGDVTVTAFNDANLHDVAVNASVAASVGGDKGIAVAGGAGISVIDFNRTVEAAVVGKSLAEQSTFNADTVKITAGNYDKVKATTVGANIAVAEGTSFGLGIGGGAVIDTLKSTNHVNAKLDNVIGENNGFLVQAANDNDLNYTGVGVNLGLGIGGSHWFAGIGAGVGVGVGNINEENTIAAEINNTNLTYSGSAKLAATNHSIQDADIILVDLGLGGIGLAIGVTSVNENATDLLKAESLGSTINKKKDSKADLTFDVSNYYDIEDTSVNVNLALLAGAAIGVSNHYTDINSSELLNISGSNITVDKLELQNKETHDLYAHKTGVSVAAIPVATHYTNFTMGSAVQDRYSTENRYTLADDAPDSLVIETGTQMKHFSDVSAELSGAVDDIITKRKHNVYTINDNNQITLKEQASMKGLTEAAAIAADNDANDEAKGQVTAITNSTIKAMTLTGHNINKDLVDILAADVSVGALGAATNIIDVNKTVNNSIKLEGSTITADDLELTNLVTGNQKVDARLGYFELLGFNVAYAHSTNEGDNKVEIDNSTITVKDAALIGNKEDAQYKTNVKGGGFTGLGGSKIEAITKDMINNTVDVTGSTLISKGEYKARLDSEKNRLAQTAEAEAGAIKLFNDKVTLNEAETHYVEVGLAAGFGNAQEAYVNSTNTINFNNNTVKDGTADRTKDGKEGALALYSHYASTAKTGTFSVGVPIAAGGSGNYVKATNNGDATINAAGNTFDITNVLADTLIGSKDGSGDKQLLAHVNSEATDASLAISGNRNYSTVKLTTKSQVVFDDNNFATDLEKTVVGYRGVEKEEDGKKVYGFEPVYEDAETGKVNLDLNAITAAKAYTKLTGRTGSLILAVGNNHGQVTTNETNKVVLKGGSADNKLNNLNMLASGYNRLDNLVDGTGGGILNISPFSAVAVNDLTHNNQAEVSGTFEVKDKLQVHAQQKDEVEIHATSYSGGVVEFTAGEATNTMKGNSVVTVDKAELKGKEVNLEAQNEVTLNKEGEYFLKGGSGGVIDLAMPTNVTNTLTKNAQVDVKNSTITAIDSIDINAFTFNNLNVRGYFKNGGVISDANVTVNNTVTYGDIINLDSSHLYTTDDYSKLNINAADDSQVFTNSVAWTMGAALAVAVPKNYTTINRTNSINVLGKVDGYNILSNNDLNMYAGNFLSGKMGGLFALAECEAYTYGIIPAPVSFFTHKINQTNTVNIDAGVQAASVANTKLYAKEGAVHVTTHELRETMYGSSVDDMASYTTNSSTNKTPGSISIDSNNTVSINGELSSGVKDKLIMNIGKSGEGEIVIVNKEDREIANNAFNNFGAKDKPTITYGEGSIVLDPTTIKYYETNVGLALYNRYVELENALTEYSSDKNSPAYTNLYNSYMATINTMVSMGIAEWTYNAEAKKDALTVNATRMATVMELPDVVVSGGDITVDADNLIGTKGSIIAKGSPIIDITNNTNLYLKLNDLNAGEAGGKVVYNGSEMTGSLSADNAKINSLNKNNKSGANFGDIKATGGTAGSVKVESTFSGGSKTVKVQTSDGKFVEQVAKPYAAIELAKDKTISNKAGEVTLKNKNFDLLINGHISGSAITLDAGSGGVTQNATAGITNIGADPMVQYKDYVQELIKNNGKETSEKYIASPNSAGTIAGGNIFIAGEYINVNGLIQSGYADYVLDIPDTAKSLIEQADKSGQKVCLVEGGSYYDAASDTYKYKVAAYYNPHSKKIEVPDIETYAGNITLSGKLLSTGNGRIKAVDGAYDININNKTDSDIELGTLMTTQMAGKIILLDQAKGTEPTVITRESGVDTYAPVEGLGYYWNNGSVSTKREFMIHTTEGTLWGLIPTKDQVTGTVVNTVVLSDKPKDQIGYVSTGNTMSGNTNFSFDTQIIATSHTESERKETRWETGAYGCNKHSKTEWYVDEGTTREYTTTINASHPIAIGFIGSGDGSGSVSVESGGSVFMQGYIGSKASDKATVNITSHKGSLIQGGGNINASQVNLSAAGSMEHINIQSLGDINLKAINTATKDTTYYRGGVGSKVSNGNAMDITATVNKTGIGNINLISSSGNTDNALVKEFALKANGNIKQTSDSYAIGAQKIDLTSTTGSIGTATQSIKVTSGDQPLDGTNPLSASLNASANGNIYLQETEGDLRIGKIYSAEGDVYLETPGTVVDALPYSIAEERGRSEDELVDHWTTIGLFDKQTVFNAVKDKDGNYVYTTEENAYPALGKDGEQMINAQGQKLYYKVSTTETDVWNKEDLLYSISDTLINPQSGLATSKKAPNIKAKNITIKAGNAAGLNSEEVRVFELATLGKNKEDLKFLQQQDATNVSWNENNNGKVIVRRKLPIGIELLGDDGKLNIVAGQKAGENQIYVEGRLEDKTSTRKMDIYLANIMTVGDVLLNNSLGSFFDARTGNAAITANQLNINTGAEGAEFGSIGAKDNYLFVNLQDGLSATARDGVYIHQIGDKDLLLHNISSNGDIMLISEKGIMSQMTDGYLRLEKGSGKLSLIAKNGDIGAQDARLSVLNFENPDADMSYVFQAINGNLYLYGHANPISEGDLPAGTLKLSDIVVKENGILDVLSNGSILLATEELDLDKLILQAGLDVKVDSEKTLDAEEISILAGSIKDTTYGGNTIIKAEAIALGQGTIFAQAKEQVGGNVNIEAIDTLKNGAAVTADMNVSMIAGTSTENTGDIKVTKGDVSITAGAGLENAGEINVGSGNVTLKSGEGLSNTGAITARSGSITLKAGDEPAGDNAVKQTKASVNNTVALSAYGNITLLAYGRDLQGGNTALNNTGEISSAASITMKAFDGSVTNKAVIDGYILDGEGQKDLVDSLSIYALNNIYNGLNEADNKTTVDARSVKMTAETGSVDNYMNVVSTIGNTSITAGTSIVNRGSITVDNGDAVLDAGTFVENYGQLDTYGASVITAGTFINNKGSMNSMTNSTLTAGDFINNKGSMNSRNNSTITASRNIVNEGELVSSKGSVSITSVQGSIYNEDNADLYAGGGNVTIKTLATGDEKASISNTGDLAATGDIILSSANGDVYNRDDFKDYNGVALSEGNIVISAPNGKVDNTQNIYAEGTVSIFAKEGLAEFAYDIFAANKNNEKTAISLSTKEAYLINRSQLIAEQGDIELNADVEGTAGGSVINLSPGDILALSGNVTITAGAAKNAQDPEKLFIVNDLTSKVTDKVKLVGGEEVDITDMLKKTQDYADFKAAHPDQDMVVLSEHDYGKNTTKIYYLPNANAAAGTVVEDTTGRKVLLAEVEGVVDLFREGDVLNRGNIVALGKTTDSGNGFFIAEKDSAGKLVGGDITIITKHGNLTNFDDLSKVYNRDTYEYNGKKYQLAEGSIKHSAPEGYYYNNMQLESGRDLWIESQGDAVIGEPGTEGITAGGTIHVISTGGSVINKGSNLISAGESVIFDGHTGVLNEGDITAGDNVDFKAAEGDVVNKGNINAGKDITLETAKGDVIDTGKLEAGGDVSITAKKDPNATEGEAAKGNVTISGEITADKNVSINADTDAKLSGDVTAKENVSVNAGNDATVSGDVEAKGNVDVDAKHDAAVSGNIKADENVDVTAGNDVALSGSVDAKGDVDIKADSNVVTTGEHINADGLVNISGANGVSVDSTISGGKDITVESSEGSVELKKDVEGEANVTVTAKTDATVSGDVTAKENVSVSAGNDASVSGDVTAKENVSVSAGNDAIVSGDVKSEENVDVDAKHDASVSGNVNSEGNTNITAGNDAALSGYVDAKGDVAVNADGSVTATGDHINADGLVNISGINGVSVDSTISGGKDITVESSEGSVELKKDVEGEANVTVTAKTDATVSGNIEAKGNVDVDAKHDATVRGNVNSEGNTNITAGNDAALSGNVDAKGNVDVRADNNVVTTGDYINAEGLVNISGTNSVRVGSTITGGKDITVDSTEGSVELKKKVEGEANVTVTAKTDATLGGDVIANQNVNITAGSNVGVSGNVESKEDINIKADNTVIAIGNHIDAEGLVNITGTNGVRVDSVIHGGKDITAESSEGSVELDKRVVGDENVTVNAKTDVTVNGDVVAQENVTVSAGNDAALKGNVDAKGDVEIKADNDVVTTGEHINAEGLVNISGINGVSVDSAIDGGKDITVDSAEGFVELKQNIIGDENVTVNAKTDATVKGDVTAKENVSVTAGNDATVSGDVNSEANTNITAGNDARVSGDVTAKENVSVSAGYDAYISGNVKSEEDVTVTAGNDASVSGNIEAKGNVDVDAKRNATVSGDIKADENVDVTAGKDVALSGNVDAKGDADIKADNQVTTTGKHINAEGLVNISGINGVSVDSTITGGKDITADSSEGSVELKKDVEGGANVSVTAKTDATVSGDVTAKENVGVSAGNDASVSGNVEADQNVNVSANNDARVSGDVTAKENVGVSAGNDASVSGNVEAKGNVNVDAKHDATISGDIKADENVDVTAGNDVALSGNVDAKGDADIKADNQVTTTGEHINAEGLVNISGINGVSVDSTITGGKDITADSSEGSVELKKDIEGGANVSVTAKTDASVSGNVNSEANTNVIAGNDASVSGDVTAKENVSVSAGNDASVSGNVEAKGNVNVDAKHDATISGNIKADENVDVTAGNDVALSGNVDAKGDADIKADNAVTTTGEHINAEGLVNISGINGVSVDSTITGGKDITVDSSEGSVELKKDVEGGANVSVTAKTDATVSGNVNSEANTNVIAGNDASVSGDVTAKENVGVSAGNDASVSGNVEADQNVNVSANNDARVSGDVTAKENVGVSAGNDASVSGNVEAKGNVNVDAKHDATISGNIKADENVDVTAGNDVVLSGSVDAKGDADIKADNAVTTTGEHINAEGLVNISGINGVIVDSTITGGKDITVEASEGAAVLKKDVTGGAELKVEAESIVTDGVINSADHIFMDASKGDLSINKNVQNTAGGIELYAKDGKVDISQNVVAGDTGLLRIYAELEEQELSQKLVDAVVAHGELKSINGSVDIGALNGAVTANKVSAKEMAAVGTDKGDVVLGDVSAGTVVLYNKDANSSVEADHVVVGKHLVIQSADPEIKKIEAAPGAQQITLDITGTGGKIGGKVVIDNSDEKVDYQFSNLAVGTAIVKTGGNISINNLYVNGEETSELIAKERVAVDSLAVAHKLFASGYNYTASVYGIAPKYDGSNAIYYDNGIGTVKPPVIKLDLEKLFFGKEDKQPVINSTIKELDNLHGSGAEGSATGMHLYINDAHNQSANGELLHKDDFYYVHNQRYSAEALSKAIADYKAGITFNGYYLDNLGMFERFDLYELSETQIVDGQIVANTLVTLVSAEDAEKAKKVQEAK